MVNANSLKIRSSILDRKKIIIAVVLLLIIVSVSVRFLTSNNSDSSSPASSLPIEKTVVAAINEIGFKVSQPKAIPEGFVRVYVDIISENASATKCEEVVQLYSAKDTVAKSVDNADELPKALQDALSFTEIDMYTYSPECGYMRPQDSETYNVGDHPGWISDSDPTQTTLIEIAVNQALVRIETSLNREEITKVLSQFVPFSETPPIDSVVITNS